MGSLQATVRAAEDRYRNTESELNKSIKEYKVHVQRAKNQMQEHGGSVAYLAEKARMKQHEHAREVQHAKSDRSCQPEIEKLTTELEGLYKWKREAVFQGCSINKAGGGRQGRRNLIEDMPKPEAAVSGAE